MAMWRGTCLDYGIFRGHIHKHECKKQQHLQIYMCVYTHRKRIHIRRYICMYIHVYVNTYMHACMHLGIHFICLGCRSVGHQGFRVYVRLCSGLLNVCFAIACSEGVHFQESAQRPGIVLEYKALCVVVF